MIKYIFIIFLISSASAQSSIKENRNFDSNKIEDTDNTKILPDTIKQTSNKNTLSKSHNQNTKYQNLPTFQKTFNHIKNMIVILNKKNNFLAIKVQIKNLFDKIKNNSQKTENKTAHKTEKKLSIELESAFSIEKNNLLEKNYSWIYSVPYIDTNINYQFSKNLLFEMSFDISYIKNKWDTFLKESFIQYKWIHFFPSEITFGHFEYPILNFSSNDHKFSKKTLLEKNLFPEKTEDIGIALKVNIWKSFYLSLSSQIQTGKTELLSPLNTAKNTWTASLIYEKENQHINASYLKQNFFSKKQKQAFGLGYDFSYPFHSLLFNIKGELWQIKYFSQNTLSYYTFPSIQWKRLAFFLLLGKAHHKLYNQKSKSLEYILKTDFYLTDELFLSLEKIKESDTITKNSSWIFSIKSHFSF